MTLILRPVGRGAWTPVLVRIEQSRHAPRPLDFVRGQRIELAGQRLRVVEVRP